jgi:UDP-2,3-diacylglucosamine hydrolase
MLALIVGSGRLPAEVVARLPNEPLIYALEGFVPDGVNVDRFFRLETLGTLIAEVKDKGVTDVCFVGSIQRPPVDPSRIDAATMPLVPIIQKALMSGDDGALRAVIEIFEQAGLHVRAAHELAPDLLAQVGCPTEMQPSDTDQQDAARGTEIVQCMCAADVGQACVILRRQALAIEGVFGTDWMLQSLTQRPDAGGGVLFKAPKPDQDRRVDLPTIGTGTVTAAVAAGLAGIVIEHGGVIVLDWESVVAECDRLGLFLWVRERAA